jgi:hypothetical protein
VNELGLDSWLGLGEEGIRNDEDVGNEGRQSVEVVDDATPDSRP